MKLITLAAISLLTECFCFGKPGDTRTRFYETMVVSGIERSYLVNLPPDYDRTSGLSLVLALHGGGGNAEQFERTSGLTDKAGTAGFVVVYPEGVRNTGTLHLRTWNAGNCCQFASQTNVDDVSFIANLIDKLTGKYKVDPRKVYLTGLSNGGMLAYRLACEIPEKIAAIAVSSCTMVVTRPCNPVRPVPILHMQSAPDTKVPYRGGTGILNAHYPPIDSVMKVWSALNGCTNPPKIQHGRNYTLTQWTSCSNNTSVQYYLTSDGGHGWQGGLSGRRRGDQPSVAISANDLLWDFFRQYRLP